MINKRVRIKGVRPDSAEYDTGTVTRVLGTSVRVRWDRAKVSYWEDLTDLELLETDDLQQACADGRIT
jgi:hypothetical protein